MNEFTGIEAVVFDIGGTLLDFARPESLAHLRAGIRGGYDYLCRSETRLPTFLAYRRRIERRLLRAYLISRLLGRELDPMKELREVHATWNVVMSPEALTELARQYYAPTLAIGRAHPKTPAVLAELTRRGYKLAIISNTVSPAPGLDSHLVNEGLLEFFPVRIYSCVFGVPKPNPRIFHAALEALNVPAPRAVYVGDKPRIDVRGARRAGMRTVLRARDGRAVPSRPPADHVIREIADLLEVLPRRAT